MTFTIEDKKLLNSGNRLFVLTYDELLDLLISTNTFNALDNGGVDNWEWYGMAIHDYVEMSAREYNMKANKKHNISDISKYEIEKLYADVEVIRDGEK